MAVGVDYSLFYLRREREERAGGSEPRASLFRAASTSGQAVLISGATVLIAMAGMFIAGSRIFTGMAIGTMLVVLCAVIGSLTVLPAMLSKLGDRVDRGRVPYIGTRKHAAGESRFWGFVLDRVLRRPVLALVVAGGLLLLAATPALSMHTKLPSFTDMPRELPIVQTYKAVLAAFPGAPTPAEVVIQAPNVRAPARARARSRALERRAVATRPDVLADPGRGQPRPHGRRRPDPARGQRRQCRLARGAADAALDRAPEDARDGSRASSTRWRARPPARTTSTS